MSASVLRARMRKAPRKRSFPENVHVVEIEASHADALHLQVWHSSRNLSNCYTRGHYMSNPVSYRHPKTACRK